MGSLYLEPKNSFPRLSRSWPIFVNFALSLSMQQRTTFKETNIHNNIEQKIKKGNKLTGFKDQCTGNTFAFCIFPFENIYLQFYQSKYISFKECKNDPICLLNLITFFKEDILDL